MDLVQLRQAWEHFEQVPRPEWPLVDETDELGDLIADLFLPEAYIAPAAMTALKGGGDVHGIDVDLSSYQERLGSLQVSPADQPSLASTKVWFDALHDLLDALQPR